VEQLSKARIDIMGLQEVRWYDSVQLNIDNYTLLWSGPPGGSPRYAGVALAIDRLGTKSLILWHLVNPACFRLFQHSLRLLQVTVTCTIRRGLSDGERCLLSRAR